MAVSPQHSQWLPLLIILVAALAATSVVAQDVPMSVQHELWMQQYERVYKDDAEKARRFEVFKAKAKYVDSVNRAGNRTYTLRLNKFADLTTDEVKTTYLGYRPRRPKQKPTTTTRPSKYADMQGMPASVNWVAQGAVTGIKDQGECGCCWAFAAVAATEGAVKITTGKLMSLSEQQVLDCTGSGDTCDGGYITDALDYIAKKGLTMESMYPYTQERGTCNRNMRPVAHISSYSNVPEEDEMALASAVAKQPVAVAIDASDESFHMYGGGIYYGDLFCGTDIDHAVVAVGYGTDENGVDYWLLKNQWGRSWGEDGYMRIMRSSDMYGADCGLTMEPSYPN